MKSGKQKREELKTRHAMREAKAKLKARLDAQFQLGEEPVNQQALKPNRFINDPYFITLGKYRDLKFTCVDCDSREVWTAKQQKWWYEVAKGDIFTTARRCRACRRRERERREAARHGQQAKSS